MAADSRSRRNRISSRITLFAIASYSRDFTALYVDGGSRRAANAGADTRAAAMSLRRYFTAKNSNTTNVRGLTITADTRAALRSPDSFQFTVASYCQLSFIANL